MHILNWLPTDISQLCLHFNQLLSVILSHSASSSCWTQTVDLGVMGESFYHCAATHDHHLLCLSFLGGEGRAIRTTESQSSGPYYKHITIVHDDSIMTLQVVASPMIVILITLEVSFMLLANIYSRGVAHDNRHVMIVIYL